MSLLPRLLPLLLLLPPHGELHERIRVLDRRIAEKPTAELHLHRGELHRAHRDWKRADADYARALELDPKLAAVHAARARLELARERFERAEVCARRFVAASPEGGGAHALLASISVARGDRRAGEAAWQRAMGLLESPRPAQVLARADNLERLAGAAAALVAIEAGLRKLPRATALELEALKLEEGLGRTDAAIARLERIAKRSARRDRWLEHKARLLGAAGRSDAARSAWRETLEAIDELPLRLRRSASLTRRRQRTLAALAKLEEKDHER